VTLLDGDYIKDMNLCGCKSFVVCIFSKLIEFIDMSDASGLFQRNIDISNTKLFDTPNFYKT